ncbi:MAG: helix-turn-helix domain-containing protein, partial [Rhodobacteraceae bacterium]|nr:helix-turn-helix domain-containing protein [Paracoccaceae bacterium]
MNRIADFDLPAWVPGAVRLYLDHVEAGVPLRELARREGCHASTILRAVRRTERRRDDPLLDQALHRLGRQGERVCWKEPKMRTDPLAAAAPLAPPAPPIDDTLLAREGLRVLRKLAEPHSFLAVAAGLDRAAVLRDVPGAAAQRLAVVDRAVAQAFAVKEWIACVAPGTGRPDAGGRVVRYDITAVGRAALRRMQVQAGDRAGLEETAAPFAHQHRDMILRDDGTGRGRHIRYNAAESPVSMLGRKRDKDGKPYLEPDLIRAAERLREDFETAQMGP